MRAVVQRVRHASVTVAGEVIGRVGPGMMLLLGVHCDDTPDQARWLAAKVTGLRIFADGEGKMNKSVEEIGGDILVVSQFTLYGNCEKGRRPNFMEAAQPEVAIPLYEQFLNHLRATGIFVATGKFGADMLVELANDGPVTIIVDTPVREARP